MENLIKLGLIKGRHQLPIEQYIVEESQLNVFTKKELQPIVKKGIEDILPLYELWGENYEVGYVNTYWQDKDKNRIEEYKLPTILLYITGLTIVTLIAVELLTKGGYNVEIMGFNPNTQQYYLQGVFNKNSIKHS